MNDQMCKLNKLKQDSYDGTLQKGYYDTKDTMIPKMK